MLACLQLSLRCTEAESGAQPKVEGEDASDWLVVDAGQIHELVPVLYCCTVQQICGSQVVIESIMLYTCFG